VVGDQAGSLSSADDIASSTLGAWDHSQSQSLANMESLTTLGYDALDRGVLPDFLVRRSIRYLCNQRLREIAQNSMETAVQHKWEYIEALKQNQVAIEQDKANEQHYEVHINMSLPHLLCIGRADHRTRASSDRGHTHAQ
jgi:hypothetical protein